MAWSDESRECFDKRLQLLRKQQKSLAAEMEKLQSVLVL